MERNVTHKLRRPRKEASHSPRRVAGGCLRRGGGLPAKKRRQPPATLKTAPPANPAQVETDPDNRST